MAGRGGDQRPLSPPYGRDLFYASLLFERIWNRRSEAGRRFAREHERLYKHWRRLVKAMITYRGGTSLMAGTEHELDILELSRRSEWYPKPRPLTSEEQACWEWRTSIAQDASLDIYVNLGRPDDGDHATWKIWGNASSFLAQWAYEPAHNANPDVKQKRRRRRDTIVKYRHEVSAFCERWRLRARWAAPAIIQHHFFRAGNESVVDQTEPPLRTYAVDPGTPVSLPLTVKLPGRTQEQFERDRDTELNLAETSILQAAGGWLRVVRNQYSREEHAVWEKRNDSSCVLLEWNGRRLVSSGRFRGQYSSTFEPSPSSATIPHLSIPSATISTADVSGSLSFPL